MPYKLSMRICFLRKRDGGITPVELAIKRRAGKPLPVSDVTSYFVIDEPFLKYLGPPLPGDIATASREEAGYGMAPKMMDPPFLTELSH